MKRLDLAITFLLFLVLSFAAWGQGEALDPEVFESRQLDLAKVKGIGPLTHYRCQSQRIAKFNSHGGSHVYTPEEVKKSKAEFHLLFNEGYDISMVNMYDVVEKEGLKNWFLLFGSFRQQLEADQWFEFDFDLHSLIKVPEFIREAQAEAPLELITPYHYQAYLTHSFAKPPWRSRLTDPVIYAGGTFPEIGQMDVKLISNMSTQGLASLDATFVVIKVSRQFAKRSSAPKRFRAEFHALHRPGGSGQLAKPHIHDVLCEKLEDMDDGQSVELFNHSNTFEWEKFFDGEINIIGTPESGTLHREAIESSLPMGLGAELVSKTPPISSPVVFASEQLLQAALRIHGAKEPLASPQLSAWQVISGAGLTALGYMLWRGAQPGMMARGLAPLGTTDESQSSWRLPEHPEHSLAEVKELAQVLIANNGQPPQDTPESLIEFSLEVAESLRWRQWYIEECQDKNCI